MRILFLFLIITTLQLFSCTNRQETVPDGSIEDTTDELLVIQGDSGEYERCEGCWENPYVEDVEGDPDFFKKIENGDTNAFETFYQYTTYTYKREDISKLIKYALLLEKKTIIPTATIMQQKVMFCFTRKTITYLIPIKRDWCRIVGNPITKIKS